MLIEKEIKPGYKTSEFFISIITVIASITGSLSEVLPPKIGFILATISSVGYAISRGIAKK